VPGQHDDDERKRKPCNQRCCQNNLPGNHARIFTSEAISSKPEDAHSNTRKAVNSK
jgi:hypothetical protein